MRRTNTQGKVIAIANQKGGVGKTTLTTLISNILHFKGGIEKGFKVAILDLDEPQFSTFSRRKRMEDRFRLQKQKSNILQGIRDQYPILQVYPATLEEAPALIEAYKNEYDFIFLDLPGTLNTKGSSLGFVYVYVNHFFIPVFQCGDTVRSSIDFYKTIHEIFGGQSPELLSCHFFFNRIPYKNELAKYIQLLSESNAPIMKHFLYQYRVFEKSFRSTIIPIALNNKGTQKQARNLLFFVGEMLQIINDPLQHQFLNMASEVKVSDPAIIEIPISSLTDQATIEQTDALNATVTQQPYE